MIFAKPIEYPSLTSAELETISQSLTSWARVIKDLPFFKEHELYALLQIECASPNPRIEVILRIKARFNKVRNKREQDILIHRIPK